MTLRGTLDYPDSAAVLDLDVFRADPQGPGGRAFAGKFKVSAGTFEVKVPASLGQVLLEVFLDQAADGPTPGDPFAACPCNPVDLGRGDVSDLRIVVR